MNTISKKIITLILALGLPALAGAEVLTSAADFVKLPVGGRFSAMNGNVLATASDIETLNASIGGMSRVETMQVLLQHEQWFLGVGHEVFGFVTPLKLVFPGKALPGVAAVEVQWLHTGTFASIDSWGNEIDQVGLSGIFIKLGYAMQLVRNSSLDFGAGLSFGFVGQSLLTSKNTFDPATAVQNKPTIEAGAHAKLYLHSSSLEKIFGDSISAALVAQNIDFSGKGTEMLPLHFKLGVGGQLYKAVTFDIDVSKYMDKAFVPGIGLEYWLKGIVAFRTGFKYDPDNKAMLSVGVGFKYKIDKYWMHFDYGTQFLSEVSAFPPMNFSLKFEIEKIEIKDKTDIYYYKGVDYFVHNNYKEAIDMWEKVLKANPDHAEAKKRIAEAKRIMKLEEDQKKMQNLELNYQQFKDQQMKTGDTSTTNSSGATADKSGKKK